MSNQTKARYFPSVYYTTTLTPFGAIETNHPNLYDNGVTQGTIYKIDTLYCLKDLVDETLIDVRDLLYKIVSASGLDNASYKEVFSMTYGLFPKFREYVEIQTIFKEDDMNFITSIVEPLRNKIDKYQEDLKQLVSDTGGIILMQTHDYIIVLYKHDKVPDLGKCTKIV